MQSIKKLVTTTVLFLLCVFLIQLFFIIQEKIYTTNSLPYNVLLVSIDTLRADHMGVYGYNKNTTPNIDEWAKKSVVFTNTIIDMPWTYPSFVGLMTGQQIFTHKVTQLKKNISKNTQTLAKILKKNGYANYGYVTNLNIGKSLTNLYEGFNIYEDISFGSVNQKEYEDFVDKALTNLEKNKKNKNFTWIHLSDPHAPYYPPDNFKCTFNTNYCEEIYKTSEDDLEKRRFQLRGYKKNCDIGKQAKEKNDLYQTLYDGEIGYVDSLFKRILDKVKKNNLDKNTIIVLYGDHGEGFDHDFYFDHGDQLYNSQIRVPLIISYPLTKEYYKINTLVSNTDFLPTILDLLHISKKSIKTEGISFAADFSDNPIIKFMFNTFFKRKFAYSMSRDSSQISIYDGEYKYIQVFQNNGCLYNNQKEELYNLKKDPKEEINLISKNINNKNILKTKLKELVSKINPKDYDYVEIKEYNKDMSIEDEEQKILKKLESLGY